MLEGLNFAIIIYLFLLMVTLQSYAFRPPFFDIQKSLGTIIIIMIVILIQSSRQEQSFVASVNIQ